eukprot:12907638-Prorocentrum_lima.AAC.1
MKQTQDSWADATTQTIMPPVVSISVLHQTLHSPLVQERAFGITPLDTPGMASTRPPPQVEQNLVLDSV